MPNDSETKKAANGDNSKFAALFDGKSLDGWEVTPVEGTDKQWRVEDGNIITEVGKRGSVVPRSEKTTEPRVTDGEPSSS